MFKTTGVVVSPASFRSSVWRLRWAGLLTADLVIWLLAVQIATFARYEGDTTLVDQRLLLAGAALAGALHGSIGAGDSTRWLVAPERAVSSALSMDYPTSRRTK